MNEIIGNTEIFEEVGRMGFEEVFDERVDPATYAEEISASDMLDNMHEDNAFHVYLDNYRNNDIVDDFENLIDMAGN
jgi:hypothetical protein